MSPVLYAPIVTGQMSDLLDMPKPLQITLEKDRSIVRKLRQINPALLQPDDEAYLDKLDKQIEATLTIAEQTNLYEHWHTISNKLHEICRFGYTGPVETIVAMMLSGAALMRTDIPIAQLRTG